MTPNTQIRHSESSASWSRSYSNRIRIPQFVFNNLVKPPPCIPGARAEAAVPPSDPAEVEGLLTSPLDETAALPADLGQSGFDVVPEGEHALAQRKSVAPADV